MKKGGVNKNSSSSLTKTTLFNSLVLSNVNFISNKVVHRALCSRQDIPDDELVAGIFSEASQHSRACRPPGLLSGQVNLPKESSVSQRRVLGVHFCPNLKGKEKTKDVMFLEGSTLEETRLIAAGYQNIVPVTSSGGRLALLDPSAPFLFRGRRRYYRCKQCSKAVLINLSFISKEVMDEKMMANTLSVELLQFVLVMKLELQDATDTLDVFLMKHAEQFFGVSAEDASTDEEAQNRISQSMDILCPPEGSVGQRPWLDLCLLAYRAEDDAGQNQTCYQICDTALLTPSSTLPKGRG